jgi:uncharacterized iron-regulated protein
MRYFPAAVLAFTLALGGCAGPAPLAVPDLADTDVVLLGEQHDAARHRELEQQWVTGLAQRGHLAALVLEMAERGHSTAGLPAGAGEAQVQQALHWSTQAWPWDRYRPAIMAAVRAGVPVLGANLSRAQQAAAMRDPVYDGLLPGPALKAQQQAIRIGHCQLLPESQIRPMTRVQIARDQSMAQAIAGAVVPGKVVVLVAGAGHVEPRVGVPRHLPRGITVRAMVLPPQSPKGEDPCAPLRGKVPAAM